MFFEVEMRRMVVVEPRELGDAVHTKRAMIRRLLTDVDAERCNEEHGYFVAVTTLDDVSEGKVRTSTGAVVFWVSFKCIVFKPIRNEVIDAEVTDVMHGGFWAACGPARIFIQRRQMDGFEFREGPSMEYNKWADTGGIPVAPKSLVRLRVVGVRWDPKERTIMTIGSLNGNHLGPVQEAPAL